jgi:AhpD family alkylhydroperoxidase
MKPQESRAFFGLIPDGYRALGGVEAYLHASGLEHSLIELVKMRASQINGCAFCLNMHSADARKAGETEQRLYLLNAWRDTALYSERERAALEWTELLTRLGPEPPPEAARERVRRVFSDTEAANLTVLAGMINLWNRVAIGGYFQVAAA